MKKDVKKPRKLQLSRETLRELMSAEAQRVVGGNSDGDSCPSGCGLKLDCIPPSDAATYR
jgi:hypothetical protein